MVNREAERKRLVKILKENCHCKNEDCEKCSSNGICFTHREADHLLDNGIVVPPVKVGQTVYTIIDCKKRAEKLIITGVHYYSKYLSFCALSRSQKQYYFEDDDIGKTVFTSREDAEKALEGSGEK